MNAQTDQLSDSDTARQRRIPTQTSGPAPSRSRAVNKSSAPLLFTGEEISDGRNPSCILHVGIPRRLLAFSAQQPGRSNEADWRQTCFTKFVARSSDSGEDLVILQVKKFGFVLSVNASEKRLADSFRFSPRAFVEIAVNDNLVSIGFKFPQPGSKARVIGRFTTPMVIGYDE